MIILVFFFLLNIVSQKTPSYETDVLVDIYHSLGGSQWHHSNNWLHGDPCLDNWFGIECNDYLNIIDIELSKNNLKGKIPDSIGNLTSLKVLMLDQKNYITGTIPDTIGNLINLKIFSVAQNTMSGAIPESIGNLKSLTAFHICYNEFTSLPDTLDKMDKLYDFRVDHNKISSKCPENGPPMIVQKYWLMQCEFQDNPFPCPLPHWASDRCKATCVK